MKHRLLSMLLALLACQAQEGDDAALPQMLEQSADIFMQGDIWDTKRQEIAERHEFDCRKASGHEAFCACLNNELFPDLDFNLYIQIGTATPDQLLVLV